MLSLIGMAQIGLSEYPGMVFPAHVFYGSMLKDDAAVKRQYEHALRQRRFLEQFAVRWRDQTLWAIDYALVTKLLRLLEDILVVSQLVADGRCKWEDCSPRDMLLATNVANTGQLAWENYAWSVRMKRDKVRVSLTTPFFS